MIAGNNAYKCFTDIKYNLSDEAINKIIKTKKALKSEITKVEKEFNPFSGKPMTEAMMQEKASLDFMYKNFESQIIPSIYNSVDGYDTQTSFYQQNDGTPIETLKGVSRTLDTISRGAKYENGTTLEKSINALYDQYKHIAVSEPTEKEIEQEGKAISKNTKSIENEDADPSGNDNPMKNMAGYKQLEEWLKKMKGDDSKKKRFMQMQKMSDLQKVSVVEFVKPKALLMKKIVNKELYCKQTSPSERFMHIMTDLSGSMGDYHTWRNLLLTRTYEECVSIGINVATEFWHTSLYTSGKNSPQKIRSKMDLENKALSIRPGGSDRMGYCALQKLQSLQRKNAKQYILCISDGTGSIDDREQAEEIERMAIEKNIEIKFALFSKNNDMNGTKKENIFYIYD